jgi:hypothetical protein
VGDDVETCSELCRFYFSGADLGQLCEVEDAIDFLIADLVCFQRLHIRPNIAEIVDGGLPWNLRLAEELARSENQLRHMEVLVSRRLCQDCLPLGDEMDPIRRDAPYTLIRCYHVLHLNQFREHLLLLIKIVILQTVSQYVFLNPFHDYEDRSSNLIHHFQQICHTGHFLMIRCL